ncbi:hypothetical protein IFM89_022650 [Coptis chinensis]|uniref:SWIM-type domain-containing protein n=1 Tax=Coptis chinensis TaxID=261450 RepID=A0A835H0I0_9MAGN|nr:hypothetical protein IFM89_022650 [Coptis chinensis]
MKFSVIGVFCYNGGTLSFRFGFDSSIDVVTCKVCDKWPDLGLRSFSMCFSSDAKENLIETDGDLRSLACYCYGMKIATVEIKTHILDFARDKPDLTFGDITVLYTRKYGLSISRHIAYAGKKLVLKELYGDVALSYNDLLWYTEELKRRDPGNIVELEVNNESGKFEKAFLGMSEVYVLSDRHHGLLVNIPIVFPNSYHSFCLWHMENNLRTCLSKSCGMTKALVTLFKKCAYAATHEKFEEHMAKFKEIGGDALSNFLNRAPYEYWANAYFCGAQYGEMCSSLAECFNSWIDKERHLPITAMLDGIRMKMMKMASARRMECKNWKSFLCPKIEAKLLERTGGIDSWIVTKSMIMYLKLIRRSISIGLICLERDCTCNKWGIDGFPCRHGIRIHCK